MNCRTLKHYTFVMAFATLRSSSSMVHAEVQVITEIKAPLNAGDAKYLTRRI